MTLLINGQVIADDIDVWKLVGKLATPWDQFYEFNAVNGSVEIRIKAQKQNAIVSGIDITAPGGALAGGPLAIISGNATNQTVTGASVSNLPADNTNIRNTSDINNNSTEITTTPTNSFTPTAAENPTATNSTNASTGSVTTTPATPVGPSMDVGAKFYTANLVVR